MHRAAPSLPCRQGFIPPYLVERLADVADPDLRSRAQSELAVGAEFRAERRLRAALPGRVIRPGPQGGLYREVYSAADGPRLPGRRVRAEGQPPTGDTAVDEAYDNAGVVWAFYDQVFDRQSLDDRGMALIASVHLHAPDGGALDNAFWNGEQMAYGDGDDVLFGRFTQSLEVVGHELTHGVQAYTSRLAYYGEAGALNEHFADVFGLLAKQWHLGLTAADSDWLVGADVLRPLPGASRHAGPGAASTGIASPGDTRQPVRRAIRDMLNPGCAFRNDPLLGDDPQPAHASRLYRGPADNGGVHINSGVPNRAFALAACAVGGHAWEHVGRVWFEAMVALKAESSLADCAAATLRAARADGAVLAQAVERAWQAVGVPPATPRPARPPVLRATTTG